MKIELKQVSHRYASGKKAQNEIALHPLNFIWEDGGAYALLGPSGCGKTTLLNIISGLVRPTAGQVLFDDRDVTTLGTVARNIAQMFQFPVVYDTMTVYENLAFPLRNRRLKNDAVDRRVREIAAELEIEDLLTEKARGLGSAQKQIVSLGRGLVRSDVAAILLDEPLTVVDPTQKWQLRRKLKQIQKAHRITTIYVTHDQLEALTFGERILVMRDGRVLQAGTPADLFETPADPFVGFFIGSPGMNFLTARLDSGSVRPGGQGVGVGVPTFAADGDPALIGIRPQYVIIAQGEDRPGMTLPPATADFIDLPGEIHRIEERGPDRVIAVRVQTMAGEPHQELLVVAAAGNEPKTGDRVRVRLPRDKIRVYPGGSQATGAGMLAGADYA